MVIGAINIEATNAAQDMDEGFTALSR